MMSFNRLAIAVVLCATVATGAGRHIHLDDRYMVDLEITGEGDAAKIKLELNVTTTGYVGFGINVNGTMQGADLFIGGVNADGVYYGDYIGTGHEWPTRDQVQNWNATGEEKDGVTPLTIERFLDTKDPNNEDIKIENSNIYVIWSIGETDDLNHHGNGNRGAQQLNLMADDSGTGTTTVSVGVLLIGLVAAMFQN
ncbi:DBH-like monooxygenase protein 2 [Orchesella cincta]|uniref:DBH-like monooxygenase protein 2 n=1 Tax=Orchesella cincta TaxID=48709 RepID=A0A1D2MU63_ORCCI|nr:DBH-like monooxygenase protein 2 [Orchesella cincta]